MKWCDLVTRGSEFQNGRRTSNMKVVALVSGGKDSCMAMIEAVKNGHEIIALSNLYSAPPDKEKEEIDSYMYQTVGCHIVSGYAKCMQLPLFRREIKGKSVQQDMIYDENLPSNDPDEVEDLYLLLKCVKKHCPDAEAVSSGAILSDYQRLRVENVCQRLGLVSLTYLWRQKQEELLQRMIDTDIEAIIVKVACMGLNQRHLGKNLVQMQPIMLNLNSEYGANVCGEGGEFESLTLDCPLFKSKIIVDEQKVIMHSNDAFAPVAYLHISRFHLEQKQEKLLPIWEKGVNCKYEHLGIIEAEDIDSEDRNSIGSKEKLFSCKCGAKVHFSSNKSTHSLHAYSYIEPEDGDHIPEGMEYTMDIEEQTEAILSYSLDQCRSRNVQPAYVQIYLKSMDNFKRMNSKYNLYFNSSPPSRACISMAQLPNAMAEIMVEIIAFSPEYARKVLHVQSISNWAPACIGPYSQVASVTRNSNQSTLSFYAGQIALDPASMAIKSQNISDQIYRTVESIKAVHEVMNNSWHDCINVNIYVTDIENLVDTAMNMMEILDSVKQKPFVLLLLAKELPRNASVEIQLVCSAGPTEIESKKLFLEDSEGAIGEANLHVAKKTSSSISCFHANISLSGDEKNADQFKKAAHAVLRLLNVYDNTKMICKIFLNEQHSSIENELRIGFPDYFVHPSSFIRNGGDMVMQIIQV